MTIKQIVQQLVAAPYKDRKTEGNGAILLCSVPDQGPLAWHHEIHRPLQTDEIALLEQELCMSVPEPYKDFLQATNGLNIFSNHLRFCGRRFSFNRALDAPREPYSIVTPNTIERPRDLAASKFIIGSYFWDGAKIMLDRVTERVECWSPDMKRLITTWPSLAEMLESEIARLPDHFDQNGHWLSQERSTTPDAEARGL